jgi:hypothetical protein
MHYVPSILLALVLAPAGQASAGYAAVKTKDGVLVARNVPDNRFTVELKGRKFEPMEHPHHFFIEVDGTPVQVLSIPVALFHKEQNERLPAGELLRAHLEWERPNLEELLKSELTIHSMPIELRDGIEALYWKYQMPSDPDEGPTRQLFLTRLTNRDYLLVLNAAPDGNVDEEAVRSLLVDAANSFQPSDQPIDLKALSLAHQKPAAAKDPATGQKILHSPDRKFSVTILEEKMENATDSEFFTLVLRKGNETVVREPTMGFLLDAHWSPDGKHVAINSRRGNSGDYLWVLRLSDGKVLKRPEDGSASDWESAAAKAFKADDPRASGENFVRHWLVGDQWLAPNQLQLKLNVVFRNVGTYQALPVIEIDEDRLKWINQKVHKLETEEPGAARDPTGDTPESASLARAPAEESGLLGMIDTIRRNEPVTPQQLGSLTVSELRIVRNAVFARHGRAFQTSELATFFRGRDWYRRDPRFSERRLTATDRANVAKLLAAAKNPSPPDNRSAAGAMRLFLDAVFRGNAGDFLALCHPDHPFRLASYEIGSLEKLQTRSLTRQQLQADFAAKGPLFQDFLGPLQPAYSIRISLVSLPFGEWETDGPATFRKPGDDLRLYVKWQRIGDRWFLAELAETLP